MTQNTPQHRPRFRPASSPYVIDVKHGPGEPRDPSPYCRCGLYGVEDLDTLADLVDAGVDQWTASLVLWDPDRFAKDVS